MEPNEEIEDVFSMLITRPPLAYRIFVSVDVFYGEDIDNFKVKSFRVHKVIFENKNIEQFYVEPGPYIDIDFKNKVKVIIEEKEIGYPILRVV